MPQHKLILDVGCGDGSSTVMLAQANPGARIVAIDQRSELITLAQQRSSGLKLKYGNVIDFQVMAIENLPELGLKFDFINCGESFYLEANLTTALQAIGLVLAEQGIIHLKLPSFYDRANFLRGQELASYIGLIEDDAPGIAEAEVMAELLQSMYPTIGLRDTTLSAAQLTDPELVRANFLIPGDRGFTIPDLFGLIEAAGLTFNQMTNWHQWQLSNLFRTGQGIPALIQQKITKASAAELLHIYELLNPVHPWLDCWCSLPQQLETIKSPSLSQPLAEWDQQTWQSAIVHLNPQLKTQELATQIQTAIANLSPLAITDHFNLTSTQPLQLLPQDTILLRMLWSQPRRGEELIELWQQVRPIDLLTFQPISTEAAFEQIRRSLLNLEQLLLILVESAIS